jgi:DNA-binding transcriptional ArsR family regulator
MPDGLGPAAKLMMPEPILRLRANQMRVELDKKSLFALASDTRLEILRSLQPMRRTVSQLSETLNIDRAAVHRHLKKMEEGGLVKRYEEHGFVYYGLTWKAKDLLTPNENTRVVILLSAMWVALLAVSFFAVAGLMAENGNEGLIDLLPTEGFADNRATYDSDGGVPWTVWGFPALASGAVALTMLLLVVRTVRRPLQVNPDKSTGVERPGDPEPDD